jgi:uncharacterized protein
MVTDVNQACAESKAFATEGNYDKRVPCGTLPATTTRVFMNTSSPVSSARDLFDALHRCVLDVDADGQADLFAENGRWELPFATEHLPKSIEGRGAIRRFSKAAMEFSKNKGRRWLRYTRLRLYDTADPHTIFIEFDLEGIDVNTGQAYSTPFVQHLEVRDGKIVLLRDYFVLRLGTS